MPPKRKAAAAGLSESVSNKVAKTTGAVPPFFARTQDFGIW
jgi:hypothetical protein